MSKGKTLVEGIRTKNERKVNDLRTFEAPPEVKVFKVNPNNPDSWNKLSKIAIQIREEPPTLWDNVPKFNGRKSK